MRPSGVRFAALRKADAIYLEEVDRAGLYDAIWQALAVLLPVKTVGVMGDGRTYDNVCALRAVASTDGMTADYYPFPHEFLGQGGDPHHQRGARHQPRGLRRDLKAARDDRRLLDLDLGARECGEGPGIRKRLHHEKEQNTNTIQRQCREMQVASECPALGYGTIGWGIAPRYPTSHRPARRHAAFF